jgi:transcriptional regulator with XRE-family HTH domain
MRMKEQKHHHQDRQLPPLSEYRLRRLRARLPLDVLAVRAGIPFSSLSRFERGEHALSPEQLSCLEETLRKAEARLPNDLQN